MELASQRLNNYPLMIGPNFQCPRCWIEHEKQSALRPVDAIARHGHPLASARIPARQKGVRKAYEGA